MIFPPSRPIYKDTLTSQEILGISQEISRIYSPVASVKSPRSAAITLSPKELFEISEEITRKYTPKILNHITHTPDLVLLPIDPENLYASWNLGDAAITSTPKDGSLEIVLRIYPQPDENIKATTKVWFDVVIENPQTRQKVFVPIKPNASAYKAAIGKRDQDDCLTAFATSKVVHIPTGSLASNQNSDRGTLPGNIPQALSSIEITSPNARKNASGQGEK